MDPLYHITTHREAHAASTLGTYEPTAFAREGFVHCSFAHQVLATANRIFRAHPDLVLLRIDPRSIGARIVTENLEGGAELYPHVYGPIPWTAVVDVRPFPCRADGTFELPGFD